MSERGPPGRGVRLAADIGGTFTDVVLETPEARHSIKVLSTPHAPEEAVVAGVARVLESARLAAGEVELFLHGTTLATNAIIERKGARTALLTTAGFRDVLEMGFEKRFAQYDIDMERAPELVPRRLRHTVPERIAADGAVLLPLDEAAVERAARALAADGVEAVAIGFLNAYRWPIHEVRAREIAAAILGPRVSVCLSSEVCPEMREYERFSTTCANAYVRPLMAGYLARLRERLDAAGLACPLLLMMSGGGLTTLEQAVRFPVRLVESGPAGGAILAAHLARACALDQVMAFDMGGTTAKISLIAGGAPQRSRNFEVARAYRNLKGSGLPLRIPVIELVEIGAGGGSIGRVDALQRIAVGPDSAGAEPGPACYGRGGAAPTVTDANLVLGRIDAATFAGGRLPLDAARARAALASGVGVPLDMDAFWAAAGVAEIVEENMANAARVHAVERGRAVRDCTLVAFGGGAPLHAGRLAQKLGIRRAVVPLGAGVGSAIGFLRAPIAFEVVRSDRALVADLAPATVNALLDAMRAEAAAVVEPAARAIGVAIAVIAATCLAEMRYAGQGHELRIAVPPVPLDRAALDALAAAFEAEYERVYGVRIPGSAVELVAWSLTLATPGAPVATATLPAQTGACAPAGRRTAWEPALGAQVEFACYRRGDLAPGHHADGPALIEEDETTTVVPARWRACADDAGNLWLTDLGA
jgi:N-methylhydantoinase A